VLASARILVVVGGQADEIRAGVDIGDAEWLQCDDWREGVAASLRAAVAALAPDDPEALVITLGDQPLITPQVIAGVLDGLDHRAPATGRPSAARPGTPCWSSASCSPRSWRSTATRAPATRWPRRV